MDSAIQATSDDAVRAKAATVSAGYYDDPFVACVQSSNMSVMRTRCMIQPIIKRGTHARVVCMDRAIASFINVIKNHYASSPCQIVVMGAGKDTSYFRLITGILHGLEGPDALQSIPPLKWYDIDHDVVMRDKVTFLKREPIFQASILHRCKNGMGCGWECQTKLTLLLQPKKYFILPFDLRNDIQQLESALWNHDFDKAAPTLFVFECLQMYLPDATAHSLLQNLQVLANQAFLAMYEPILGDDCFGQMMERNLSKAQVIHREFCLVQTRSLTQHLSKLRSSGFLVATGCDLWVAYNDVLNKEHRKKADFCEFLDETEEWILIMRHYCLIVACTSVKGGALYCSIGDASPLGFLMGRCESYP